MLNNQINVINDECRACQQILDNDSNHSVSINNCFIQTMNSATMILNKFHMNFVTIYASGIILNAVSFNQN
jgi:hypothetical protein